MQEAPLTITNAIIITNADFKTRILKSCISDHFTLLLASQRGAKKVRYKTEQYNFQATFK